MDAHQYFNKEVIYMKAAEFYSVLNKKNSIKIPEDILDKVDLHKNEPIKVILLQEEDEEATKLVSESKEITDSLKKIKKKKNPKYYSYNEVFKS